MATPEKRCMVCAKVMPVLKGGICELCQDKIRREALGEQSRASDSADHELRHHGVTPVKK